MNSILGLSSRFFAVFTLLVALTANIACAGQGQMMKEEGSMTKESHNTSAVSNSLVGVQGYDLVSYQTSEKPLRGNGNHIVEHHGITYQFVNEVNKDKFAKNPHKYLPAYGGYCAYGVAVGKKFVGDPDVWKIVDNTLYLNLDNKIQGIWNKDISGNIQKAESKWGQIKNKKASDL
jgi:YHS domain-containing protein